MCCLCCSTLSELGLPHSYCEVVDKDAKSVMDEIEATVMRVAGSILQASHVQLAPPGRRVKFESVNLSSMRWGA